MVLEVILTSRSHRTLGVLPRGFPTLTTLEEDKVVEVEEEEEEERGEALKVVFNSTDLTS